MCDQTTILARVDKHRFITCCEHGIVHIVWNNVSLRFNLDEMGSLVRMVEEAAQLALQYRIAGKKVVHIVHDQHDQFQVWITGCGLYLSPEEFRSFVGMMTKAGKHPAIKEAVEMGEPTWLKELEQKPYSIPPRLFSVN